MKNKLQDLLKKYEQATNSFDIEVIGSLYADTFMFGGPSGVQSVNKEGFLQVIPKRKAFFSSIGLQKTTLLSFEEKVLNEKYVLADVEWSMHYEKEGKDPIDDTATATYIFFVQNDSLKIVFQIDHQDLSERVKNLGLM